MREVSESVSHSDFLKIPVSAIPECHRWCHSCGVSWLPWKCSTIPHRRPVMSGIELSKQPIVLWGKNHPSLSMARGIITFLKAVIYFTQVIF